jgi:hypothetical protein
LLLLSFLFSFCLKQRRRWQQAYWRHLFFLLVLL